MARLGFTVHNLVSMLPNPWLNIVHSIFSNPLDNQKLVFSTLRSFGSKAIFFVGDSVSIRGATHVSGSEDKEFQEMDYSYTIQMASSLKDYSLMPFFPKRIPQHRVANVYALWIQNGVLATREEEYGDAPQPGHGEWHHEIDGVRMTRRYIPSAAHQHEVCE
jgi:hypothetical protein